MHTYNFSLEGYMCICKRDWCKETSTTNKTKLTIYDEFIYTFLLHDTGTTKSMYLPYTCLQDLKVSFKFLPVLGLITLKILALSVSGNSRPFCVTNVKFLTQ